MSWITSGAVGTLNGSSRGSLAHNAATFVVCSQSSGLQLHYGPHPKINHFLWFPGTWTSPRLMNTLQKLVFHGHHGHRGSVMASDEWTHTGWLIAGCAFCSWEPGLPSLLQGNDCTSRTKTLCDSVFLISLATDSTERSLPAGRHVDVCLRVEGGGEAAHRSKIELCAHRSPREILVLGKKLWLQSRTVLSSIGKCYVLGAYSEICQAYQPTMYIK